MKFFLKKRILCCHRPAVLFPRPASVARARSRHHCQPAGRLLAELPRRLLRQTSQQTDPDHSAECRLLSGWRGHFKPARHAAIKSSPLLVNGVLYFTLPDNVWAVDARTGHQIWHYTYKQNEGLHLGHRGVAIYKEWLYFSDSGCPPDFARCKERQSPLGCRSRRYQKGILDVDGAAGGARSRDRGSRRRSRQHNRLTCARLIPRPARRNGNGTRRLLPARRTRRPAERSG